MKIYVYLLLIFFLMAGAILKAQDKETVVKKVWEHIGGKDTFYMARYLEFTFRVEKGGQILSERNHLWDRFTGNYVYEEDLPEENGSVRVVFNVNTRIGKVYKNHVEMGSQESDEWIKKAFGRYINDTYWLLVPTKLEDPGLNLEFDQEKSSDSNMSVLHLSFENVGLTPGDQYWLYVENNGRIGKWIFKLESGHEGEYDWLDEKDCGAGIILATRKISRDGFRSISFPNTHFSVEMDIKRFE